MDDTQWMIDDMAQAEREDSRASHWTTNEGIPIAWRDLTDDHLANVLAMCKRLHSESLRYAQSETDWRSILRV